MQENVDRDELLWIPDATPVESSFWNLAKAEKNARIRYASLDFDELVPVSLFARLTRSEVDTGEPEEVRYRSGIVTVSTILIVDFSNFPQIK